MMRCGLLEQTGGADRVLSTLKGLSGVSNEYTTTDDFHMPFSAALLPSSLSCTRERRTLCLNMWATHRRASVALIVSLT